MAARELIRGPALLEFEYLDTGECRQAIIGPGMVVRVVLDEEAPKPGPKVHTVTMDDQTRMDDA